jgi:adenine-specific DNA-methyltransferase
VQRFIVDHARQVFRLAPISDGKAGASTVAMKRRSRDQPDRVFVLERGGGRDPVFLLGGQQICRYDRNVQVLHGKPTATRPLTNIWTDIAWEGIAAEGGARFKQGKKPERLIQRVLELVTQPGDSVLDAFGGSGTTAAVAHKMGRAWTLIERGEQAHSIALPRIRRVVEGADRSGITEEVGWTGGGGCSVYAVEEQPA